MQSETQLQAQQMKSQTEMAKIELEAKSKIAVIQAEKGLEMEKLAKEAELKKLLMAEEFGYQQQLRDISENALKDREVQREEQKGKRIDQANTQQSQLINQRKNNLPPQSFESNEDSLDGFDLAEFEPR